MALGKRGFLGLHKGFAGCLGRYKGFRVFGISILSLAYDCQDSDFSESVGTTPTSTHPKNIDPLNSTMLVT